MVEVIFFFKQRNGSLTIIGHVHDLEHRLILVMHKAIHISYAPLPVEGTSSLPHAYSAHRESKTVCRGHQEFDHFPSSYPSRYNNYVQSVSHDSHCALVITELSHHPLRVLYYDVFAWLRLSGNFITRASGAIWWSLGYVSQIEIA